MNPDTSQAEAAHRARVGARLRRHRLDRNWPQQYLAYRIGTAQRSISNWEEGRAFPRVGRQLALAEVFEVPPDDLFRFALMRGETP